MLYTIIQVNGNHLVGKMVDFFFINSEFKLMLFQLTQPLVQLLISEYEALLMSFFHPVISNKFWVFTSESVP